MSSHPLQNVPTIKPAKGNPSSLSCLILISPDLVVRDLLHNAISNHVPNLHPFFLHHLLLSSTITQRILPSSPGCHHISAIKPLLASPPALTVTPLSALTLSAKFSKPIPFAYLLEVDPSLLDCPNTSQSSPPSPAPPSPFGVLSCAITLQPRTTASAIVGMWLINVS